MDNLKMILQRAGTFLTAIFLALTTLSVGNNLIIKKDDGVRLSAALVSDVHYGDAFYRQLSLPPGLRDISRHVKPDLFVLAGDCTDNGNDENWSALQQAIDKNLKVDNIILALGNHDTWTSYDDGHYYDEAKGNFLRYSNAIMGTDFDTVWSVREIAGYSFIILGSEADSTGATISNAQLSWLETTLEAAAAAADGKPIFVINHQPLNYTHAVGDNEHGNGFESNAKHLLYLRTPALSARARTDDGGPRRLYDDRTRRRAYHERQSPLLRLRNLPRGRHERLRRRACDVRLRRPRPV